MKTLGTLHNLEGGTDFEDVRIGSVGQMKVDDIVNEKFKGWPLNACVRY